MKGSLQKENRQLKCNKSQITVVKINLVQLCPEFQISFLISIKFLFLEMI